MSELSVDQIRAGGWRLFETVSGSRSYGTDTPESDTDLKGVFVLPRERYFGLARVAQVDDGDDIVFYELERFVELLAKNNPNIIELLYMPEDCVVFRHPLFELLKPELFLSKLCRDAFAGYAMTQVRKARGLNKKIVNPMPEERKRAVDFCYVLSGQGSVPLETWLSDQGMAMEQVGVVDVAHARGVYALFFDGSGKWGYRGIFKGDATEVRCSRVAADAEPVGWMVYNADGFKKHCKEHASYWTWVAERNEARYATNVEHGRNYDSKNLMHTMRLLDMAEEIATEGTLRVRRPNRDELIRIRRGEFDYDELVALAEEKIERIEAAFEKSGLPERPDRGEIERVLVEVRERFYGKTKYPSARRMTNE